ncbi:MAG TPA: ABC transporter ATP-binding protein [Acidimicrobiia bacterium]|nr:ABC transporter ATP-binding protein [Acidimicrobiia bacterium]
MSDDAATFSAPPGPAPSAPANILEAHAVRRAFGGLVAVDVERFAVPRGEIVGLIGPNGAGKTTFFNVLTGFERADAGEWTFDGRSLAGKASYRIARAGMVRTFQIPKALSKMTVLDNMKLAAPHQRGEHFFAALVRPSWHAQDREVEERAHELLDWVGLADKRSDYAGTLSGGQRKLLELGRSLMTDPKLLMLDEPTAGVSPSLTEQLLERIRGLQALGLTVLFVEHDMDVVTTISDRVVCMAEGQIIAEGTPREVVSNPIVIDAYLGTQHGSAASTPTGGAAS